MPSLPPDSALVVAVALPFLAALLILTIARGRSAGWVLLVAALASVVAFVPAGRAGGAAFVQPWLPALGVAFALRADGFALLLAWLVSGIGALVVLYALAYLPDRDPAATRRFYATLAVFMGAMLGIAVADDLILLFVFWELTSVASFLLIGHHVEDEDAKAGALMALQVTALGGLVMSVGFLLIGQATGTFQLSRLIADPALRAALHDAPYASLALFLVLVGACTKSAQVPFHFWLPRAMVAPTPVSAYLHAATMVKAGVFLLGRLHPLFGDLPLWAGVLVPIGAASMLLGAYQALRETDLKAILARTTAATLGAITLLYGLGAIAEASLGLLSHALYKGALFLVAGIVEHHAHTRDLARLGGLRRELPIAFAACALAALSMAGVPPLLGFLAKDAMLAALLHPGPWQRLLLAVGVVTSIFLVTTALRVTSGVFLGPTLERRHRDASRGLPLWPAPLLLATGALGLGVASLGPFTGRLVAAASPGATHAAHVTLVPALGAPLYLSLLALVLGAALHAARGVWAPRLARHATGPLTAPGWERLMASIVTIGETYSRRWQNGSLRWYLAATVLTLPALVAYALWTLGLSWTRITVSFADLPWYGLALCLLLAVATLAAVRARTRLAAAIATTTIGFLVSMLFVVYRSPDILLTQILIETVSTIFVLLVLVLLPPFRQADLPPFARLTHAAIAAAFGATITGLLLLAMTPGLREAHNIAVRPGGLLSLALAEGGGANAVNVIIVDIRAMDTTGEITVLVVVGLCVYGLLRSRRRPAGHPT